MRSLPRDIPAPPVYHSPPFKDVERIGPNSVGMVGVISQRLSTGLVTFAIFRVFERDGRPAQTGFIPADMGDIYLDFTKIVLERISELRKSNAFPVPVQQDRHGAQEPA